MHAQFLALAAHIAAVLLAVPVVIIILIAAENWRRNRAIVSRSRRLFCNKVASEQPISIYLDTLRQAQRSSDRAKSHRTTI